jgi:hypothetical protein
MSDKTAALNNGRSSTLHDRRWKRFIRGPDSALLEELYVPALTCAIRYDRCCSYFSSSVLSAAARGFGAFIERLEAMADDAPRPAVRLVVNEELAEEDVRALTESDDLARLEAILKRRFRNTRDLLEKKRLAMLGWLVKKGLLEVRVGVMRHGEGIVHAKFGIVTDAAGDAVVFSGSGNESAQGLRANYERLEVSTSWDDLERLREYADEFEALWNDTHPDVHTVTLPEALRLKLIKLAPKEAPTVEPSHALARQKAAMLWRFITEAPYLPEGGAACDTTAMIGPWPHQAKVVKETAEAWPEGRLLCDEVGLGKTIEAILVLRRLMAGRGVRRALLLLPAGLLKQWQGELREKGGLLIPRLEGLTCLVWPDGRTQRVEGLAEALKQNLLIMSRETARGENNWPLLMNAEPWDLVILDEAHAARRRQQEEGEFNKGTLLLDLLRRLQLRRHARGILLLSATPMQTHPWEPWDLLGVLGEGGKWLSEFSGVRRFYEAVAALPKGRCDLEMARGAAAMVVTDPEFPLLDGENKRSVDSIARAIAFAPISGREKLARRLRQGSPLARRMHRNTRETLRGYYELGLLETSPPRRVVDDIRFDYQDHAERRVYESITRYIDRRFQELEQEKPGKGFVMTIYRRRASSSPQALEQSLERRRRLLLRVAEQKAYDASIPEQENLDGRDMDDLGEGEIPEKVSAGLPSDPRTARAELEEVERLLGDLRDLHGLDSKRDRFFDKLRESAEDGRAVLVFTEYVDTMEYLRDNLVNHYGSGLGCYSGDGGQLWDGEAWKTVTKDAITDALQSGRLRVLVCTDAASEGLNLQAAGAVINYDLPWNPSKVEQRIGRVDRIGQKLEVVRVINLFLAHSVDDQVYRALRERCGMFEHFVGAMQPVLARARRMLLGREPLNTGALEDTSREVEGNPLASEAYWESVAQAGSEEPVILSRKDLEEAVEALTGEFGPKVKVDARRGKWTLSAAGIPRTVFSDTVRVLEQDPVVVPLTPLEPRLAELANSLSRPGERLPLVVGTYQVRSFRRSIACWVGKREAAPISSMAELRKRLESWNGDYPDPRRWLETEEAARAEARRQVEEMERRAEERERQALSRQIDAARYRLLCELGRYLVCLDQGTADLNRAMYEQMTRDIASAQRLKQCMDKLGGYPEWDPDLCRDLERFLQPLTEGQRRARLLGKELDAALEDPRWSCCLDAGVELSAEVPRRFPNSRESSAVLA